MTPEQIDAARRLLANLEDPQMRAVLTENGKRPIKNEAALLDWLRTVVSGAPK